MPWVDIWTQVSQILALTTIPPWVWGESGQKRSPSIRTCTYTPSWKKEQSTPRNSFAPIQAPFAQTRLQIVWVQSCAPFLLYVLHLPGNWRLIQGHPFTGRHKKWARKLCVYRGQHWASCLLRLLPRVPLPVMHCQGLKKCLDPSPWMPLPAEQETVPEAPSCKVSSQH